MSFNHPKAGPNYVPAYQISGIPFVTSSIDHEVPDLFNVLQAKQQSTQQQNTSKPTPGDVKQLLSSSSKKIHPFC